MHELGRFGTRHQQYYVYTPLKTESGYVRPVRRRSTCTCTYTTLSASMISHVPDVSTSHRYLLQSGFIETSVRGHGNTACSRLVRYRTQKQSRNETKHAPDPDVSNLTCSPECVPPWPMAATSGMPLPSFPRLDEVTSAFSFRCFPITRYSVDYHTDAGTPSVTSINLLPSQPLPDPQFTL